MNSLDKDIISLLEQGLEDDLLDDIESLEDIKKLRETLENTIHKGGYNNIMTYCDKCKNDRTATKDSYVCNICGETMYGFVNEFICIIYISYAYTDMDAYEIKTLP